MRHSCFCFGTNVLSFGPAVCLVAAAAFCAPMVAQVSNATETARERMHHSEQWAVIAAHLPDPATAAAKDLELQADILRARRFPEDALDFYKYAMARGGDQAKLLNKLGITELEMRNTELGRAYFHRAVTLNKNDADAWNNLGAVEFVDGRGLEAISDYKRAVKLKKKDAVFHANLGSAYFERKQYGAARKEMAVALKLDPEVYNRNGTGPGVEAHVLSSSDRARFSFEMARLFALNKDEAQMLYWLAKANDAGIDILREMRKDAALSAFENDPRVVTLVKNSDALRLGRNTSAANSAGTSMPALAVEKSASE
jgi:tetratricopeptide (TPR) repeat protein